MGYLAYSRTRSTLNGSNGKLETAFQKFTPDHEDNVEQQPSLDGTNVETTYFSRVKFYNLQTAPIEIGAWAKWEEFSHSVAGGENFTLDAAGTEAAPNNAITVKMVPGTWKIAEAGPRHHVYSFRVRV